MKSMKFKICFAIMLATQHINSTVVIWDVGGTLLTTSGGASFKEMGMFNTISYVLDFLFNNRFNFKKLTPHMRDFFLDTLALIPCSLNNPDNGALTITGKPMPALLRENLLGTLSGKEALEIAYAWTATNEKYFKNTKQRTIFEKTLMICFDPETSLKTTIKTKHFGLLKKCYEAKDLKGNRKNSCVILSNWSTDKLNPLKEKFNDIFEYSDAQIFSCNEKLLKPSNNLFKSCLFFKKKKNEICIFIDDQEENRMVAQQLGIIAVHPDDAEKTLKQYNAI